MLQVLFTRIGPLWWMKYNNLSHARINEKAVEIVKRFLELGKPIAAICHGPQL